MPRGVYPRKPRKKYPVRAVAVCKNCDWAWKPTTGFGFEPCPRCGAMKDVRIRAETTTPARLAALKRWRAEHPGHATEATRRTRRIALSLIGNGEVRCINCGCNRMELLEINHKNGGGGKEIKGKSNQFYRDIAMLRRKTDDLELCCRVCNALHYLESKYGPLPFKVAWCGDEREDSHR